MAHQYQVPSGQAAEARATDPVGPSRADHAAPNAEERAFAALGEAARDVEADGPLDALRINAGLLATAAGDRARFTELFQLVAPRAKAYLIHRGVSSLAAEALAIEAMIELWRTASAFDLAAQSGQAWIFQIVRDIARRNGVALQMMRP